jgi:hypothetical protein
MKDSGKSLRSQHRNAAALERWIPTTILIPEGETARSDTLSSWTILGHQKKKSGVTLEFLFKI